MEELTRTGPGGAGEREAGLGDMNLGKGKAPRELSVSPKQGVFFHTRISCRILESWEEARKLLVAETGPHCRLALYMEAHPHITMAIHNNPQPLHNDQQRDGCAIHEEPSVPYPVLESFP